MNRRLYDKVQLLSADGIAKDRGAFFDSVFGTLNHILVADMFWLRRFSGCQAGANLRLRVAVIRPDANREAIAA